jgi:hypothetical protein
MLILDFSLFRNYSLVFFLQKKQGWDNGSGTSRVKGLIKLATISSGCCMTQTACHILYLNKVLCEIGICPWTWKCIDSPIVTFLLFTALRL